MVRALVNPRKALLICENRTVKKLAILGSTGSIGQSTLSICESFPDRYQVVSLAAGATLTRPLPSVCAGGPACLFGHRGARGQPAGRLREAG